MSQPSKFDDQPSLPDAATGDGLPPLREVIARYGLQARKSLGQNFILDLNLTRRIARACPDLAGATVVEVGPGPGGLTRGLLMEGAGRVIAIERDDRVLPALADIAARYPGKLDVHAADALTVDWADLLADVDDPVRLCANLPYGIATKLLTGWLESGWPPFYSAMVLMFQLEVAERIVAEPGSKAYGRLAVLSQWRCRTDIVLKLKPEAFVPAPKVASAVVRFVPRETCSPPCNVKTLARVTAAAFGQRRKMLRASLKQLTPFPELLLREAGLSPETRAEQLQIADFARLAQALDGTASA